MLISSLNWTKVCTMYNVKCAMCNAQYIVQCVYVQLLPIQKVPNAPYTYFPIKNILLTSNHTANHTSNHSANHTANHTSNHTDFV